MPETQRATMRSSTEVEREVEGSLRRLTTTDELKRLFWSTLSYDRVSAPVPRGEWATGATRLFADDPMLLAAAGPEQAFHVVYSRFASGTLSLTDERVLLSALLPRHPCSLFVFSNEDRTQWHFVNARHGDQSPQRRTLRRITVGKSERLRTATERLAMLDVAPDAEWVAKLRRPAGIADIQNRHDQAFDVEEVSKRFFARYREVFERVEGSIEGLDDAEQRRLFTQRLFNRLMFIAFVEKKSWLRLGPDHDYLTNLFRDYPRKDLRDRNFYRDRLRVLFFLGLNSPSTVDIGRVNRGNLIRDLIGEVPFLNGGLFEEDDDDRNEKIVVPDEAVRAIVNDLFASFNFTVTESTPLDVEVAVDPEMLGKVFEELVTGRHETGSYYTPKPIVSFMCRETLKGYLQHALAHEDGRAIESFVDEQNPAGLSDAESVLEALRQARVCDPACGSGAYLLGMLHELMALRNVLFRTGAPDADTAYKRKLEIIQNNVYGVDIDPFAVNIARLRLWLSLAVEYDGNTPPPLPNLDFKVEVGDSLAAPMPQTAGQQGLVGDLFRQYRDAKSRFLGAHAGEKASLRQEIASLRSEIASWEHGQTVVDGFDWAVEFAEVFNEGGFDIIVANPPYVRMELFKEIKPVLRANFPQVHSDRADLYCYFYGRAIELLRDGGMLGFISSNKWFRAKYGGPLRKHVSETCWVRSITDFGELPVFEGAATFPMIFIAEKGAPRSETLFTQVTSLEPPYPDVLTLIREQARRLPEVALAGDTWEMGDDAARARTQAMRGTSILLGEYVGGKIYRGIVTGCNPAFFIDGETRAALLADNPEADQIIKPLVVGDDVRKWRIEERDQWLIYIPHGTDVRPYSAVIKHLKPYRRQLERRATAQEWYELQQPQAAYVRFFERPKIVFPDIAKSSRFSWDLKGFFLMNTCYFIPVEDMYLLGVLNSSALWRYAASALTVIGSSDQGGRLRFFRHFLVDLPVPRAQKTDQEAIGSLATRCLRLRGEACSEWEDELDKRVARLYGLEKPPARDGKGTRQVITADQGGLSVLERDEPETAWAHSAGHDSKRSRPPKSDAAIADSLSPLVDELSHFLAHFNGDATLKKIFWSALSFDRHLSRLPIDWLPPTVASSCISVGVFARGAGITVVRAVFAEPLDRAALEQSCRRLERRLGTLILIVQQMSKVGCTLVYPDRAKRRYLRKLEVPGLPDAHRLTAQALAALSAVDPGSGDEQGPLDVLDRVEAFFPGEMPRDWWAGNWPWEGNGHRDPELRWLRGYFQSISQFPLLTARQESGVDLLGTEDALPEAPLSAARWRLVTHNLRWVVTIARRYRGSGLELEDLIQEGTLGLVKAAAYFDPARGYRFLTYATWWIRQAIRQAIAERGRLIRLPVYVQNILVDLHRSREFLRTSLGREASISELAHQTGLTPQDTGRFLLVLDGTIHLIEEVSETLEDRSFSGWDRAVAKDLVASIDRLLDGLRPRRRRSSGYGLASTEGGGTRSKKSATDMV